MKIVSWNINSIRVRIEHLIRLSDEYKPDVLLLQETRVADDSFPCEYFEDLGYNIAIRGEKGRNGVAIFSKHMLEDVKVDFCPGHARYIEAFTGGAFVASVYVPNGQEIDSEQYHFKLEFLANLKDRFCSFCNEVFIAGGDFNVAPHKTDTHNSSLEGIMCSPREREAIRNIRDAGFCDALDQKGFTWWDYRHRNFFRNDIGYRIDQFYLSNAARQLFLDGDVLRFARALPRPSDHAPIMCEIMQNSHAL
ncbi:MAG: exodeoxyribonuclease III [Holosporaceae bacterium]|jgi:exodeoxyribonuclease-3|nr:exodeoxyribonuclease III [Holosporaceae bacterium]